MFAKISFIILVILLSITVFITVRTQSVLESTIAQNTAVVAQNTLLVQLVLSEQVRVSTLTQEAEWQRQAHVAEVAVLDQLIASQQAECAELVHQNVFLQEENSLLSKGADELTSTVDRLSAHVTELIGRVEVLNRHLRDARVILARFAGAFEHAGLTDGEVEAIRYDRTASPLYASANSKLQQGTHNSELTQLRLQNRNLAEERVQLESTLLFTLNELKEMRGGTTNTITCSAETQAIDALRLRLQSLEKEVQKLQHLLQKGQWESPQPLPHIAYSSGGNTNG